MSKIVDETFGVIEFDYYWEGSTEIEIYGKRRTIKLSIDGDDGGEFQDEQKTAFTNFNSRKKELLELAEIEIYKYYLSVYEEIRDMVGESADDVAPHINNKEDISRIVTPKELLVRTVHNNGIRRIGLLFECTWEPEHGLAVRFENENITEVGFQDIII